MIEGLGPYSKYREAGVPWARRIPKHWWSLRGKALFAEAQLPVRDTDEIVTCFRDGQVTLRRNRRTTGFMIALLESGYQGVRKGQLVIHAMDAFAGAIGVSDSDGKCTPEYIVCKPRSIETIPGYFAAVLRLAAHTKYIEVACPAVRERAPRLRYPNFGAMLLPVPTCHEQAAILGFLNKAGRRIDGYIRAKKKLIALMDEHKQAIIQRAVTCGLDPDARLKPSGIPWIGDIPNHWEVRRLRTLVRRIDQGVSPQADGTQADASSWGVLKAGCVNGGVFRENEHKRLPTGFQIDPNIVVNVGDILVSRACGSPKYVGSVGRVESLSHRLILCDKTFRLVFRSCIDTGFAYYALNSRYYRVQVHQAISGAEGLANNLPLSSLRDFLVALPPLGEGSEIAENLGNQLRQLDSSIARIEHEISLLREYRSRLIADLVTGQLDVREAARHLPNEFDGSSNEFDDDDTGEDAEFDSELVVG
jgi:type I restriction enzyme S subunit